MKENPQFEEELKWNINNMWLSSTIDETKFITKALVSISSFVENCLKVDDFYWFVLFKQELNDFFKKIFSETLSWYSENFLICFLDDNIWKFTWNKEDENKLISLIRFKKLIYVNILKIFIAKWKFNNLLNEQELSDLSNLLDSNIFTWFDSIFINWKNSIENIDKTKFETEKPYYWWIIWDKIVSYEKFLDKSDEVNSEEIELIKDENIRKFFSWMLDLIKTWDTNYDSWVKNENYEIKTWKNSGSSLVIIWPMEDYFAWWLLVEPEIEIHIRQKSPDDFSENKRNLSKKYFLSDYDMKETNYSEIEPLIRWWCSAFKSVLWKAFPNDENLSNEEWNFIYSITSRLSKIVEQSEKNVTNIFWQISLDINLRVFIIKLLMEEVAYHEFGHSLFIKWHSSKLEEAKATLFFSLKLYDDFYEKSDEELKQEDIEKIILFFIVDSIRNFERMAKPQYEKYLILTKLHLNTFFRNWLIYWDKDRLCISKDKSSFKSSLSQLKDILFLIKDIYEKNDTKTEEEFLSNLDKEFEEDLQKILKFI